MLTTSSLRALRLPAASAAAAALALTGAIITLNPTAQAETRTQAQRAPSVVDFDRPAWAAEWMVKNVTYTQESAVAVAKRYDVIAAMSNTFKNFVPAMRQANPDLVILAYVNGPFAAKWADTYPDDLYARDGAGRKVTATRFDNFLMRVHTPGWRQELVRLCNYEKSRSGYDGCFLDSMGNGILNKGYLSAPPIDPRTGQAWTKHQWIKDTAAAADFVRTQTGLPVATNGLGSGYRFYSDGGPTLVAGSDMSMAEGWLRNPKAGVNEFPSESVWLKSIDMIVDSEELGSGMLAVTKLWVDTTEAQRQQWYEYTLGTFLLGSAGRSRMFFLEDGCVPPCSTANEPSPLASQPSPTLEMGTPQAHYAATGNGIVTRPFSAGFVAVNPTGAALRVTLPAGTWRRLNGTTVSGTTTVDAHHGLVVQKVG